MWEKDGWVHCAQGAEERIFRGARCSRYPRLMAVSMDGLSLGALPDTPPVCDVPSGGEAAAGIDFGSSAAATAILMGDSMMSITGADCRRVLMQGEFAPVPVLAQPVMPSALQLCARQLPHRPQPMLDSRIPSEADTLAEGAENIIDNIPWRVENDRQEMIRLYMLQLMLTTALACRLQGADRITWRFALPDSMA
ncbi:MAG: hypothetical protein Q4C54_00645 [Clostridia bacterium]|nr:hypothetical protein [Clostridia bacterium]